MKRSVSIFLAILSSLLIWLVANLSETNSDIVSVRVLAHSNLVGHSNVSGESVTVAAAVSGSGFSLLRLAITSNRVVDLNVDPADLIHRDGDFFTISDNTLFKYASELFGPSVSVKSFLSHSLTFRFLQESYRKLPLYPLAFITCQDQYMLYGDMSLSQDSVYVYGDPVRLESMDKIVTRQIVHKDVNHSVHGVVDLETPAGMRLSQTQITYSQNVTRYVEYSATVNVGVKNLPAGKQLTVFPSVAKVNFRFIFPISGFPAQNSTFYIDYQDFSTSLTGKCMLRAENLPDVALSWESSPLIFDCVETAE